MREVTSIRNSLVVSNSYAKCDQVDVGNSTSRETEFAVSKVDIDEKFHIDIACIRLEVLLRSLDRNERFGG